MTTPASDASPRFTPITAPLASAAPAIFAPQAFYKPPAPVPVSTTVAIDIRNLHYRFPDNTHALRGISLTIFEGETAALIGPNGAGKSTLILHLNALLPENPKHSNPRTSSPGIAIPGSTRWLNRGRSTPTETGPVTILGHDLANPKTDLAAIRRDVGLLFQDPNDQLFCPTVFEDVAFGPQQLGLSAHEVQHRVEEALAAVHLEGFQRRHPHHLSGGEQRRVCLAGVLACKPRILVLDEPTSNLDPRGRRELKALLREIPITKIIATHDLEMVVELCSKTFLLNKGTIAAAGPTLQLLNDEQLMLANDLEKPHILYHMHPHGPIP